MTTAVAAPAFGRPPGPKGAPFVGSLLEMRRDPLGFFTRIAREYGDVVRMRELPDPVDLAIPVTHRLLEAPREVPVAHDEARADEVLDAQVARQRLRGVTRGGRHDREEAPFALVARYHGKRVAEDGGADVFVEPSVVVLQELGFRVPGHLREGAARDRGHVDHVEAILEQPVNGLRHLP